MPGKIFDLNQEKDKRTIFRIQKTKDDPYVRINKLCLHDSNLSCKAKGLLGYMLSLPDNWVFHRDELLKHSSDGRKSLLSAIKELKEAGYLKVTPERNNSGRIVRWSTYVFESPQNIQITEKGILDKNQNPLFDNVENPECGKGTPNNKIQIQTNYKKTTQQEVSFVSKSIAAPKGISTQDSNVVVALMERLKYLAVSKVLVTSWLKKHGLKYVTEKIELTEDQKPHNPEGFLNRAIAQDWKPTLPRHSEGKGEGSNKLIYPSHDENTSWYNSLTNEDKLKCLQVASFKHPMFKTHLKHQQTSVLEATFPDHGLFKMFMSLLGRAK